MRHIAIIMLAVCAALLPAPVLAGATVKVGALVIESPWIRANPPGIAVVGGFLQIANTGGEADRLVRIEAPFADHVEIHESKMVGEVMQMRQLADGVEIGAGATVAFKPGAYHLMFLGVKTPIKPGTNVTATLEFAKAGKVDVAFAVVPPGAGAPH